MRGILILSLVFLALAVKFQRISPIPQGYVSYKLKNQVIVVDGKLDEPAWQEVAFSPSFVDIRGAEGPKPRYDTKMKIRHDDEYLYIGAYLEEPHVNAHLTERHSMVYLDNAFEVFFDPAWRVHQYTEYQMNAFNTIWTLLMINPYRDSENRVNPFPMIRSKSAVFVDGTLNDPRDVDQGWSVEMAFAWKDLQFADRVIPPKNGHQWRIQTSRVHWEYDIVNGTYIKRPGKEGNYWVWTPQGSVNMHIPERYGIIQFSNEPVNSTKFTPDLAALDIQNALFTIYNMQKEYFGENGKYATKYSELGIQWKSFDDLYDGILPNRIVPDEEHGYVATIILDDDVYHVRNDSKQWSHELEMHPIFVYYLLAGVLVLVILCCMNCLFSCGIIGFSWITFQRTSTPAGKYQNLEE